MIPIRLGGPAARPDSTQLAGVGVHAFGGLVGGLVGGAFVVVVTLALKEVMDFISVGPTWLLIVVPLIGLALALLVLQGLGVSEGSSRASAWRTFPRGNVRADITGDIVDTAGREERFQWRLAPIRVLAIFATVGSGAAMGTESPAAYLGMAAGAWTGDRGRRWRRILRPAAIGGGAAGVAALMSIPLVGTAYILEIGKRNGAPYEPGRVIAALIGGLVGWGIDVIFDISLIRLVVPRVPPVDITRALVTALFVGALSGGITSLTAAALYRAKKWTARPLVRFIAGGLAAACAALLLVKLAGSAAAFGPGGGAILWAESHDGALPSTLLAVALLRAAITTAAAAAGGCGGIFLPFLAIGDLTGRVFAPVLDIGHDLAGAAGAAGGIAGGYRLPLTALAMVLGVGGPPAAQLTSLAAVGIAYLIDRFNPLKR